jgi:hypothetical protein
MWRRALNEVAPDARADLTRARRSAVVLGFMTDAAAPLGAVIAWFAACAGERHRDRRAATPSWVDWGRVHALT